MFAFVLFLYLLKSWEKPSLWETYLVWDNKDFEIFTVILQRYTNWSPCNVALIKFEIMGISRYIGFNITVVNCS